MTWNYVPADPGVWLFAQPDFSASCVEVILDFDTTCVEVGFLTSAQVGQKLDFGLPTNLVGGWVFIPDKLSGS